jgi:cytidine deaminase
MLNPDPHTLIAQARKAATLSYSPYSAFPVGAALLCDDGSVILGTNVENRSFGLTNCAERSAVYAAVSLGKRNFTAIAIACPHSEVPVSPCGACRQVLSELCPANMAVYFAGKSDSFIETTLGELLPQDGLHELKRHGPPGQLD